MNFSTVKCSTFLKKPANFASAIRKNRSEICRFILPLLITIVFRINIPPNVVQSESPKQKLVSVEKTKYWKLDVHRDFIWWWTLLDYRIFCASLARSVNTFIGPCTIVAKLKGLKFRGHVKIEQRETSFNRHIYCFIISLQQFPLLHKHIFNNVPVRRIILFDIFNISKIFFRLSILKSYRFLPWAWETFSSSLLLC